MSGAEGLTRADKTESSSEFEPRTIARRAVPVFIAIIVVILIALLAPGLGEVRGLLDDADPAGSRRRSGFEALSFSSVHRDVRLDLVAA